MNKLETFSVCRRCGRKVKGDREKCPDCGHIMDLETHLHETIGIHEEVRFESIKEYYEKNKLALGTVVLITIISPAIGAFLIGPIGIAVGLCLGLFSFVLSPYAVIKIREIRSSD